MATLVNDDVTISPTGGPAERFTSRDPEAFEIPTGRDESWRFSPVDRIRRFFTAFEPDGVTEADNVVPAGAHVDAVEPSSVPAFGSVLEPVDRVSALVMTHATQGLHVRVDAGAELDAPIILRRKGISGSSYVHHIVEAGAGSRATIIIDPVGNFPTAAHVEVIVGDSASLSV
ncbi:MAG: Fe-S cluster assembly protein SufD, partial [Mycobacteriales bacterium]